MKRAIVIGICAGLALGAFMGMRSPRDAASRLARAEYLVGKEDYKRATPAYLAVIDGTTETHDLEQAIHYFHDRDDAQRAQIAIDKLKVVTSTLPAKEKSFWLKRIRAYETGAPIE